MGTFSPHSPLSPLAVGRSCSSSITVCLRAPRVTPNRTWVHFADFAQHIYVTQTDWCTMLQDHVTTCHIMHVVRSMLFITVSVHCTFGVCLTCIIQQIIMDLSCLLLDEILRQFWLGWWSVVFVCLCVCCSPLYRLHFNSDLHQTLPAGSQGSLKEVINFWESRSKVSQDIGQSLNVAFLS